jgi:hypothetical protein
VEASDLTLEVLPGQYVVCRLASVGDLPDPVADPTSDWPTLWVAAVTDEEVSLVCPVGCVPPSAAASEGPWSAIRVAGLLDFSLVGILAGLTAALAGAGIAVFVTSTYRTDYVLVQTADLPRAMVRLAEAGYPIRTG